MGALLPRLPPRPLTEAEAFGFRLALSCVVTMCHQPEREPTLPMPANSPAISGHRAIAALARGLALQLGRAG